MTPASVTGGAPAALEARHITAGYQRTPVLHDVSITVPAAGVTALLGPNGAGKTTLLRVASGAVTQTSGRVLLGGEDVTHLSTHQRVRRGLCDIPERRGIFPSLTVRENLRLQSPAGQEEQSLERMAQLFPPVVSRLRQLAGSLSGGEQQMLAVARAYITNPTVVVVDEVSLGLAPKVVELIFEQLSRLADEGRALLVVEQYVTRALALADTVCLLDRGSIVVSGSAEDLAGEDIFERYLGIEVTA